MTDQHRCDIRCAGEIEFQHNERLRRRAYGEKQMEQPSHKPFAHTRLATYVAKQIDALKPFKSRAQIAQEVGYDRPNVVSMIKTGDLRMPLDKVPAFAKALGVDVALLMRLAIEQHWGEDTANEFVRRMFSLALTDDEMAIVKGLRVVDEGATPELSDEQLGRIRRLLREAKR